MQQSYAGSRKLLEEPSVLLSKDRCIEVLSEAGKDYVSLCYDDTFTDSSQAKWDEEEAG